MAHSQRIGIFRHKVVKALAGSHMGDPDCCFLHLRSFKSHFTIGHLPLEASLKADPGASTASARALTFFSLVQVEVPQLF